MKILSSKKTSVILVIILGCLLSSYGYWMILNERNAKIQSAFDEIVTENADALEQKVDDYFDVLQSVQSFYESSQFVSRDEFRQYAGKILKKLSGIQALEWLPAISGQQRTEFENSVIKEGFPGFQIKEMSPDGNLKIAGAREKYFPVTYFEPAQGNEKALGFDFISEKIRAEALSKAIETRELSVIPSIPLVQNKNRHFLIGLIPFYQSSEGKPEELKGVIRGDFKMDVIFEKALQFAEAKKRVFCFQIFDITDKTHPFEVYSSIDPKLSDASSLRFLSERRFEAYGHVWKLSGRPCSRWLKNQKNGAGPISVLFSGVGATLLFALYLSLFIDRTKGIEKAVVLRTAELAAANEKISASEKNFRGLVSNIPGAVYRCAADKDWTMEFISDEIEKISGYPGTDFIGNKVRSFASIIHPDDTLKVEQDVQKGIDSRAPYILEYRILDAEGKERWIYEKGQAIFSAEGKVLYLDGAIFDITERKKLSEQLLQSKKMEAIGKLSGGIAHDFNNHLMVVLGYCEILIERMNQQQFEYSLIQDIKLAAEKSSALVRQLLAFGRKSIAAPAVFDLNALIHSIEKMVKTVLGEKITLELNLSGDSEMILMDPSQMEQVLLNMVVNARDAMFDGGTLAIETRNVKISNETKLEADMAAGDYVLLTLKDTGVGMDAEVKKHLFEPFFTTKEKHKGTGLGLATCYGIIRAVNGIIEVQSQPGQGTVFSLYIPASSQSFSALEVENEQKEIPSGSETILIVEDEAKVRLVTALILKNRGYRVLEFASGKDAIDFLEASGSGKIDLLLTDVVMPEMNGPKLAGSVKKLQPGIRTLFMSGYMEDILLRNGIEKQQVNFLQKPCETGKLCRKIREILDQNSEPFSVRPAA